MPNLENRISKKIGQAIFDHKMINKNDKILVGVSGGKDSMTLLYDLAKRQRSFPIKYTIEAAHIIADFGDEYDKDKIIDRFKEWGINYHVKKVNIIKRLKPDRKMNCYWCSNQRRIELLKIAKKTGCNKIALGHHMDDIIETYLLNIFFRGETATMLPKFTYDKFPYSVIRPLAFVKESQIREFAEEKGFTGLMCNCGYGEDSRRLQIKQLISDISSKNKSIHENIFRSMSNVNMEYML